MVTKVSQKEQFEQTGLPTNYIKEMAKDFIANNLTSTELRQKYNVSIGTVRSLIKIGDWRNKRKKFIEKMVDGAIEDTGNRFKMISEEVSKVFYKQMLHIKHRLLLVKDGEEVPPQLMKEAMRLHELIQKDLMKVKDIDAKTLPSEIAITSNMPSVLDMQQFKPKITGPPEQKEEIIVETKTDDSPV